MLTRLVLVLVVGWAMPTLQDIIQYYVNSFSFSFSF